MPATIASTPAAPQLAHHVLDPLHTFGFAGSDPVRIHVFVPAQSAAAEDLSGVVDSFQVERLVGTASTTKVVRDWTALARLAEAIDDGPLEAGRRYGYRVRWKNAAGTQGPWSDWSYLTP